MKNKGLKWSPEPETPPPGHHLRKIKNLTIFKRTENREDSSDFDDFWIEQNHRSEATYFLKKQLNERKNKPKKPNE